MEIQKAAGHVPEGIKTQPVREPKKEAAVSAPVADQVELKGKSAEKSTGIMSKAKAWIKTNITGDKAEVSSASISDYQDKTALYAGLGAAAGGAAGTVVGAYAGYKDAQSDVVTKGFNNHDISDSKLTGYDHRIEEDGHYERDLVGYEPGHYEDYIKGYDDNGKPIYGERWVEGDPIYKDRWVVDGYWHRFSADIDNKKVGEYKTPTYEHESKFDPLTGGLVGLIGGSVVGGALGLGYGLVQKALHSKESGASVKVADADEKKTKKADAKTAKADEGLDFTGKAAIAGGAIGAAGGAAAGYAAGRMQEAAAQRSVETWNVPVTERKLLGYIPSDYYSSNDWWGGWDWQHVTYDDKGQVIGGDPVYRDVPVLDANGKPVMKEVTGTISSQRYGVVGGTLGGMALGGVAGAMGGVAVGLLHKLATDK